MLTSAVCMLSDAIMEYQAVRPKGKELITWVWQRDWSEVLAQQFDRRVGTIQEWVIIFKYQDQID